MASTATARASSGRLTAGPPYVLNTPPPPAPGRDRQHRSTYTASVTGGVGMQYQWDFDDGTAPTPFSSSPTVTHVFTQPGIYYVTVTARDASGRRAADDHRADGALPAHGEPAGDFLAISLVEDRPTGADRLWVVNQDNDSVSVFNTSNGSRAQARSTSARRPARSPCAPNGEVWVTNKCARRSASSIRRPSRSCARSRCRAARSPSASWPTPAGAGDVRRARGDLAGCSSSTRRPAATLGSARRRSEPAPLSRSARTATASTCRASSRRPCRARARLSCRPRSGAAARSWS